MTQVESTIAKNVGRATAAAHLERTGQAPDSVAVVLSGQTLVVTLNGALSPAERNLAKTEKGAAKVQEFHRQLFVAAMEPLREQIKKIVGVDVLQASTTIDPATGIVVQAFASGSMVQVFLLSGQVATDVWSGPARGSPLN
jgi:uncharacterized protein YbcI